MPSILGCSGVYTHRYRSPALLRDGAPPTTAATTPGSSRAGRRAISGRARRRPGHPPTLGTHTIEGWRCDFERRQDWVNRLYVTSEENCRSASPSTGGWSSSTPRAGSLVPARSSASTPTSHSSATSVQDLYPHSTTARISTATRPCADPLSAAPALRVRGAAQPVRRFAGRVLDAMDALSLWDDMLIVTTDHGFCWASMTGGPDQQPWYSERRASALCVGSAQPSNSVRRDALAQMIDLPATLLEFFGVEQPRTCRASPCATRWLLAPTREANLFGVMGAHVNVTDGRYVYMRGPVADNTPLYEYTLMPTHLRAVHSGRARTSSLPSRSPSRRAAAR